MPKFIKRKVVASREIKSVWSYRTRRLFQTLNEVPWLSLTALGTLLGVSVLFWYFRTIDFFPSDFSALIGLGVGAAASAVGVLCIKLACLFAPAGFYRFYLLEPDENATETKRKFTEWELIGLQLGGIGCVFGLTAYPDYRDCGNWLNFYGVVAMVALFLCLIVVIKIVLTKGKNASLLGTSSGAVGIALVSISISLAVIPLMPVFRSEYLYATSIFFTLWAFAILINAFAATSLRTIEISIVGWFAVVIIFVLMPVAINERNFFPEMTANFLGIRDEGTVDLRVSEKTCQLIRSAVPEGMINKDVVCAGENWGKARVQILSKVGEQWLIEFEAEKTEEPKASTKLRLTISREDIQVVRAVEDRPFLGKPAACKTTSG